MADSPDGCEDCLSQRCYTRGGVPIEEPEGFELYGSDSHVRRLKKALYGLKHESRAWYKRIDAYLQQLAFQKSDVDPNLYFILVRDDPLILVLYVGGWLVYYRGG